jgi:general nucleoside transport system ATP-binding protein
VARTPHALGPVRLAAMGLTLDPETPHGTRLEEVSFELRAGEILGIAGVSGNGQAELLAALSGERAAPSPATLLLDGEPAGGLSAGARRKRGLAYVPERRLGHATVPGMSLAENALLTAHRHGLVRNGLVRRDSTRKLAAETMAAFDVRAGGVLAPAESLSGGNLQKFVVGREVGLAPKVLVVAQPTWGVDVGATAFIRAELVRLRDSGTAVLVISEDLDELLEVSDRIAVLYRGRLTPPVDAAAHDAESIGLLMGGARAPA